MNHCCLPAGGVGYLNSGYWLRVPECRGAVAGLLADGLGSSAVIVCRALWVALAIEVERGFPFGARCLGLAVIAPSNAFLAAADGGRGDKQGGNGRKYCFFHVEGSLCR